MRKDIALHLVEIGLAPLFFMLGYTMRVLPQWLVISLWSCAGFFIAIGILGLLGIWRKKPIIENYTPEELNKGVRVCVPPAKAIEIRYIELKKGEVTQIEINSVESQNGKEHYIDSKLLNRWRREVLSDARNESRGYSVAIPLKKSPTPKGQPNIKPGLYRLILSNEYQKDSEKQLRIKVSYRPYSSNTAMTFEVGTIKWD